MKARRFAALALTALVAAACGPSRGLRVEQVNPPAADLLGSFTTIGGAHVTSATIVMGQPGQMVADGKRIWVSVRASDMVAVQAMDSGPGRAGGAIATPYREALPTAIAVTPGAIWILAKPPQGHSQLLHIDTRQEPVRVATSIEGRALAPRGLRRQALAFPRDTRLVGATGSAIWLISHTARGYWLWRRDLRTQVLSRFALASAGSPGVAVTADNVFVLLQTRPRSTVVIQTRDSAGRITATSSPVRVARTFQPTPVAACGDRIFAATRDSHGAALFEVSAAGGTPRYTKTLPPLANPSKLKAIAFGDRCQDVWVATVSRGSGVVTRFRGSNLTVTGRINTSYVRALLWADHSLWASDPVHEAVIRIH